MKSPKMNAFLSVAQRRKKDAKLRTQRTEGEGEGTAGIEIFLSVKRFQQPGQMIEAPRELIRCGININSLNHFSTCNTRGWAEVMSRHSKLLLG